MEMRVGKEGSLGSAHRVLQEVRNHFSAELLLSDYRQFGWHQPTNPIYAERFLARII
ncbi:MAG TPA: hypothetical protein VKM94_05690 [Blastocatellia bacterium]|nr:hypothetical protein [Blastocatellia bacterium]